MTNCSMCFYDSPIQAEAMLRDNTLADEGRNTSPELNKLESETEQFSCRIRLLTAEKDLAKSKHDAFVEEMHGKRMAVLKQLEEQKIRIAELKEVQEFGSIYIYILFIVFHIFLFY